MYNTMMIWSNNHLIICVIIQTINKIINDIYHEAINIEETNNYRVSFDIQRSDTQVLTDTSVENTILLHGILDLHFKIL